MVLVDNILERRRCEGRPIRVALVGAGFMGRSIALHLLHFVPGLRLVAISSRRLDDARRAYAEAGASEVEAVETVAGLERAAAAGRFAVTEDAALVAEAAGVDAVIEATGAVEFGAQVVLRTLRHGKHVATLNSELMGTLGPVLKTYADRAGVVLSNIEGDQPGTLMNLYRFVTGVGLRPLLCGNIKGFQDYHRTPETQAEFARRSGQKPVMITSYTDGTNMSFEQAVVANATGMRVARRGMLGPVVAPGTPVEEAVNWYPSGELLNGPGIVDYVVGASPGPGVFVLATHRHPSQQFYLDYYKLGAGPFYCFHTPFRLCGFEAHNTVARAVEFGDAAVTPLGGPVVEVVAVAKTGLRAGQTLDGIGGYLSYGLCENADVARREDLLPMGLAEGARLKRDVPQDAALTLADVELPAGRLCDRLWAEQLARFKTPAAAASAAREGRQ
jgi:predicted homoserine dehydrogenase-like protein